MHEDDQLEASVVLEGEELAQNNSGMEENEIGESGVYKDKTKS